MFGSCRLPHLVVSYVASYMDMMFMLVRAHPYGLDVADGPVGRRLLLADRGAQCVAYRVEQVMDVLYVAQSWVALAKFGWSCG